MRGLGAERLIAALRGGEPALDRDDCERAFAEGLAPQLGAALLEGRVAVPDGLAGRLIKSHRQCLAREVVRQTAIAPVLTGFARAGIPTLLLKGAALERIVYQRPGLRTMVDTDLLVPSDRFHHAISLARSAGASLLDVPDRAVTMHVNHEVTLCRDGFQIDLHRALSAWPLFRFDNAGLFERARRQPDDLLVPSPSDLFVHLATHAAGDGFLTDLRSVLDGLLIIDRLGLSPDEVVSRATQWRARRATAAFLVLLTRFGLRLEWASALAALGHGAASRRLAVDALLGDAPQVSQRWRRRLRLLRAVDGTLRPAAFLGVRGALLFGDILWRAVRARA